MAAKKKSKTNRRRARPMKVVSLKSALHMVKQAERRIAARGMPRRKNPDELELIEENPLRHFPKLPGRGRPAKKFKWNLVVRLGNGKIAEQEFKATKEYAYWKARKLLLSGKKYNGSAIKEIILDDNR